MADEHFFYIPPSNITNNHFTLDNDEGHHAVNVLRLGVDDPVHLLDGEGMAYRGIIRSNGQKVEGEIIETIEGLGEPKVSVHLAVGMIKRDRFEWLLEKAVECGASSITPLIMDRCVKKSLNMDRSNVLVKTAAKQCGRSRFPTLNDPISLTEFLLKCENVICLHSSGEASLSSWVHENGSDHVTVIIGPEGDLSNYEMDLLKTNDIPFLSLGNRRLRTETAAITALNILEHGVVHG